MDWTPRWQPLCQHQVINCHVVFGSLRFLKEEHLFYLWSTWVSRSLTGFQNMTWIFSPFIGLMKCCLSILFIYIIYKRLVKAQHSGEKEEVGGYPEEEVYGCSRYALNLEPWTWHLWRSWGLSRGGGAWLLDIIQTESPAKKNDWRQKQYLKV